MIQAATALSTSNEFANTRLKPKIRARMLDHVEKGMDCSLPNLVETIRGPNG